MRRFYPLGGVHFLLFLFVMLFSLAIYFIERIFCEIKVVQQFLFIVPYLDGTYMVYLLFVEQLPVATLLYENIKM